jgi:hypothetical protein
VNAESRKPLIKELNAITFISADKGKESRSDFSYRNYYEAKFIVAMLDYLTKQICKNYNHELETGYNSSSSSESSQSALNNSQDGEDDGQGNDVPDFSIGVIVTYKSQEELIN